ncbi:MAG: class I SAM-dependent methyltransferase, partial [Gemmatimonadales bacterium]|nr:class I SAM-dependent methyltransferase [Gemmatimonadales bacterium]
MIIRPWWLKCIAQRVLSHVPSGYRLNALWRSKTRVTVLNTGVLRQGIRYVRTLRELGFGLEGRVALEVGPGWNPVIPYILRLAGCRKVVLCDATPHLTPSLLRATVRQMREVAGVLASELEVTGATVEETLPRLGPQNFSRLLTESGFEYRAPCDLDQAEDLAGSIDLISSHAVLEHVPRTRLMSLLRAMHRLLRPEGLAIHFIDHADHWHHFDPGIGPINFLKFPGWWWAVINSPISHQNRLRSGQHLALWREAGFRITYLESSVDLQALEDARRLHLDREFRSFTPDELAISSTFLVARPAVSVA